MAARATVAGWKRRGKKYEEEEEEKSGKGHFFWGGGRRKKGKGARRRKKTGRNTLSRPRCRRQRSRDPARERRPFAPACATTPPPPLFLRRRGRPFFARDQRCLRSLFLPTRFPPFCFLFCSPRAPEMIVAICGVGCWLLVSWCFYSPSIFVAIQQLLLFCVYYNLLQVIIFSTCILSHWGQTNIDRKALHPTYARYRPTPVAYAIEGAESDGMKRNFSPNFSRPHPSLSLTFQRRKKEANFLRATS